MLHFGVHRRLAQTTKNAHPQSRAIFDSMEIYFLCDEFRLFTRAQGQTRQARAVCHHEVMAFFVFSCEDCTHRTRNLASTCMARSMERNCGRGSFAQNTNDACVCLCVMLLG